MARRKAVEMDRLKNKGLRGYKAIWQHIVKENRKPFTLTFIAGETNADKNTVRDYLKRLIRAGYVEEIPSQGKAKLFQQIKTSSDAPRLARNGRVVVQGAGRDHMWRSVKMIGTFTVKELAIAASTLDVKVTENTASTYVTFLLKAGYLRVIKPHKRVSRVKGQKASYCFLRHKNTGPKAPMITRNKEVYDPNLERIVWSKEIARAS